MLVCMYIYMYTYNVFALSSYRCISIYIYTYILHTLKFASLEPGKGKEWSAWLMVPA